MLVSPQLIIPTRSALSSGGLGLQTNLTAFWSLESTSWSDDTGNGSTLTGNGTPPNVAAGKVGNAVSLNGSSDFLSCASNTNVAHGGTSFSAQAWVKLTAVGGGVIAQKDNNAFNQRDWYIGTRFTTSIVFSWTCYNTSSTSFNCDSTIAFDSNWHHIVATFDSSTGSMKIYVDGSASGSGTTLTGTANSSASAPFQIGKGNSSAAFAAGLIDQVGFWKGRVLSASDVTSLYNGGSGLSYAAMV